MPPGSKPKPPGASVTRHEKKYPWQHAEGQGWQHGDLPEHPDGLKAESVKAWREWFASWWAWYWTPADLPQIELAALAYDAAVRDVSALPKALPLLDRLGITPKGRQDLRWAPPKGDAGAAEAEAKEQDDLAKRRAARQTRVS